MNGTWRYAFMCALTTLALMFAAGHADAGTPLKNSRILYSFCPSGDPCHGGSYPTDLVRGPDGAYYGVALEGGIRDAGVVFRSDPVTLAVSVVHRFNPLSEGSHPLWLTVGSDGNLYGTLTSDGPTGFGNIFRLTLSGEFTELHPFDQYDWANSAMVEDGEGNWFGLLHTDTLDGDVIYKITPDGIFSILHTFESVGGVAAGVVLASDNNLYGVTPYKGKYNNGMAYRLTGDGDFIDLHDFTDVEGEPGSAAPAIGPDGALYGMMVTKLGYSMYRIGLDGQFMVLGSPTGDGIQFAIKEPLTLMPDGFFYGVGEGIYPHGNSIFRV
ncbi:MAG: hypothetical protein JSS21_11230, partial [Proteobacteria bacterium]|nr:hypothetical protein [Pseudomonadota bacterium]